MVKKPRINYGIDDGPTLWETASSGECTGLMPSPPMNEAEQAAYETLFSMEVSQSEAQAEEGLR